MSENKNQSQCMYQSVPAAAAMNRVPGFEPLNFLRLAVSEDTQEKIWRLDLRYMKAWFRMARPNGRMKLKSLRITEQIAIFEAQVYMDRSDEEPLVITLHSVRQRRQKAATISGRHRMQLWR